MTLSGGGVVHLGNKCIDKPDGGIVQSRGLIGLVTGYGRKGVRDPHFYAVFRTNPLVLVVSWLKRPKA